MKRGFLIYIVLCVLVLLSPFIGMFIDGDRSVSESGEAIELPDIKQDDGSINRCFLSDMGAYFESDFGFRKEIVSANSIIYEKLFHISTSDQVLLGKGDWLYYTSTLNDYTSTHLMTERALNNVVHNLSMMQDYVEEKGCKFVLTIAPNKNSLYSENMPFFYNKGVESNNFERLEEKLIDNKICYVNLHELFRNQDEVLYFRQDSHWNNKGALLVYNELMDYFDLEHNDFLGVDYSLEGNHIGDLEQMQHPISSRLEEDYKYDYPWSYCYVGDVKDNMDNWIETASPNNEQTLLMYRDSFGESLLPFFAESFGMAYFSRFVPYNLKNIETYQPNYVILERVERRISSFAESAAVSGIVECESLKDVAYHTKIPWGELLASDEVISNDIGDICLTKSGDFFVINGTIEEEYLSDDSPIYIEFESSYGDTLCSDTYWISKAVDGGICDGGFSLYFLPEEIPFEIENINIIVAK